MAKKYKGTIGILTGGGDVPGLNPAIRAVTIRAIREGYQVIGLRRGWAGISQLICDKKHDNSNNFIYLTEEWEADVILIHMNTYGGLVDMADSIRTKILNSPIPYWVFIDNNAASAGALISIACDSIFMRPGGNMGAATVVNQTGEQQPDKYQSYMRSTMRSTAEAKGKDTVLINGEEVYTWRRNPFIAEAMVDPALFVAHVSDTGKVLTFTPSEAINWGFCEGEAESLEDVLQRTGIRHYELKPYKESLLDKIFGLLLSPAVQGVLILLIVGGIYFELQSPGVGFPLMASAAAALLYFAPLYLEGLAANWEVIIFIAGIVLVLVEIFAIPGFGVAGISGIILLISGLALSLVDNVVFDFSNVPFIELFKAFAVKNEFPEFKAGDTITVHYKIKEGEKERIQMFRGVVIQRKGERTSETFTVRKMSGNIGVERIFPADSPFIEKIEVNKYGRVRRARIYYLRGLTGKKARIKERRF